MRTKVKIKKKKLAKNPELAELFNQMTGVSKPDYHIIEPKYCSIIEHMQQLYAILKSFATSPIRSVFNELEPYFAEVESFAKLGEAKLTEYTLERNKKTYIGSCFNDDAIKALQEPQFDVEKLTDNFLHLIEDTYTKEILQTCAMMSPYSQYLVADIAELNDKFIADDIGPELCFFSFSKLNFKDIFLSDVIDEKISKYVLFALKLIYKKVFAIYGIVTSPNIDIERFSEMLVESIAKVKSQIPGCEKAFQKILNSVDLLKGNFCDYYKSFVKSQSPTIIIESFVSDVARNTKADKATVMQFKRIIQYFETHANKYAKDNAQVQSLVNLVKNNFSQLEEKMDKKKQ